MPLVACPDCRREISTEAPSCPHCGRPVAAAAARGRAAPGPGALSGAAEHTVWEGVPSLKALFAAIVGTVLFSVLVPVGVYAAYGPVFRLLARIGEGARTFLEQNEAGLRFAVICGVVAVIAVRVAGLLWRIAVLRSHHYRLSDQRLTLESGVFSRSLEEIDMRMVEDIVFHQRLLERLLGIGQITVVSSDSSAARLRMLGIERPREVRELVRQSAYAATRGQLFTRAT